MQLTRALVAFLTLVLPACSSAPTMTATPTPIMPISATPTRSEPDVTGASVDVWLTLGDRSKTLSHEPSLAFAPGSGPSGNAIQIDVSQVYQRFEGGGASLTESSAWLIMSVLDGAARDTLMRRLFTRDGDGIGLSYLRQPMGASDFALGDYTYNDLPAGQTDTDLSSFSIERDRAHIIPALKIAYSLNPELRLMGTPWSPPAWMKKDGRLHGSSLLPEFYQAFADYHIAVLEAYAAEGLAYDTITPNNEPLHATEGYPSMFMTARDQQTFVRDYLGPALRASGQPTRLLIFDHNWDLVHYPVTVLSDPAAAAYVDGVAFHCYGGDVSAQAQVHEQFPTMGIWMTECSGGQWAQDFGDNLSWKLRNLVIGNLRNWGKSVILWNLALDTNGGPQNGGCSNCRGVVTIDQIDGTVTYNEEYYALGHLTKFVVPGAFRIGSSQSPTNVALLNPDGRLALIVQADTATEFTVAWNGQFFSYALPAAGVVTFVWETGSAPGPTAVPEPARTATPRPAAATLGLVPTGGVLADFESGSPEVYAASNAEASIGTPAHNGSGALVSASAAGHWHIVGARFKPAPADFSGGQTLCFWVYDTTAGDTGGADNTVGVRLNDAQGATQEVWTDHPAAGANPLTERNTWVRMCLNLEAFSGVNLGQIESLEFNTYWPGIVAFDDIVIEGAP